MGSLKEKNRKIGLKAFSIIFGSLFSVFLLLTAVYITNLIYSIGDYSEVPPILIGIIVGTLLFSILGAFLNERRIINTVYTAIISVAIVIIAYIIITYMNTLLDPNIAIMSSGFLINSPYMFTVEISNYIAETSKLKFKIISSIIIASTAIIIIFAFAIFYMNSNQTALPLGVSIFSYITLILLITLLAYSKKGS